MTSLIINDNLDPPVFIPDVAGIVSSPSDGGVRASDQPAGQHVSLQLRLRV